MILLVLLVLVLFGAALDTGALGERWRGSVRAALKPAFLLGGIGFVLGFFGPLIVTPEANLGPLLGIFITGPGGFLLGLIFGVGRRLFGEAGRSDEQGR